MPSCQTFISATLNVECNIRIQLQVQCSYSWVNTYLTFSPGVILYLNILFKQKQNNLQYEHRVSCWKVEIYKICVLNLFYDKSQNLYWHVKNRPMSICQIRILIKIRSVELHYIGFRLIHQCVLWSNTVSSLMNFYFNWASQVHVGLGS